MSKNCLIYETLNGVKGMSVKKQGDFMTLSGVFGVCGVRNNNKRVYETSNYAEMVKEMKERIKLNGGIPGELEHPQTMNVTLENVSHKITDINIDENGVVTGTITLLNTPKGQIAQAIVEGGLPLFISSRAAGNIDKSGNVKLENISTYDLVGTPGFSQARLKLNENQVAESINENIYYIADKNDDEKIIKENKTNNMTDREYQSIKEELGELKNKIFSLELENSELRSNINNSIQENNIDKELMADAIQNWIVEEYSPKIQEWIVEEFAPNYKGRDGVTMKDVHDYFAENIAPKIQEWIVEEYSPKIQEWIVEEYSPEVENWLNEHYSEEVKNKINESGLSTIDETLRLLESIEVQKPTYSKKSLITENVNEPKYISEMPAEKRVKWDMASESVKDSINRRAKLYNFNTECSIERFWENVNFEEITPSKNIYEGLQTIEDERERAIRSQFRARRKF